MVAARLSTAFWVSACVYRASQKGAPIVVVHKGDGTAGAVLIKADHGAGTFSVLAETRTMDDERAWFVATGTEPIPEQAADGYIARSRQRDTDLWVIEMNARDIPVIVDEPIIAS